MISALAFSSIILNNFKRFKPEVPGNDKYLQPLAVFVDHTRLMKISKIFMILIVLLFLCIAGIAGWNINSNALFDNDIELLALAAVGGKNCKIICLI
jgi:hypothetical protein